MDKAFCTVCGKDFGISAMGESAVSRHAKGKKLVDRLDMVCVNSIANYTKKINDISTQLSYVYHYVLVSYIMYDC